MKLKFTILSLLILGTSIFSKANDSLTVDQDLEQFQAEITFQFYADSISNSLKYEHGVVNLKNNIATIKIPQGYKYLNGEDADMVLTDLWGNPPREGDNMSLGMLMPESTTPMSDSTYLINITYSPEGFIDDADAKELDYDDLFDSMREDMKDANPSRVEQGYPTMDLVSWASPPYYDAESKKLHWAKELKFGEYPINTLNYSIRVLGRKGYLELNVIGEMPVLEEVKSNINPILESVNFNEGNRYADFNPDIDQVAAYGIGGLIAGKVLMKAGLLAKAGLILAKFWKIIAIAFVGFFAGIKKFFGKKEEPNS
jgi:uncharacterized membrane-anchored protein